MCNVWNVGHVGLTGHLELLDCVGENGLVKKKRHLGLVGDFGNVGICNDWWKFWK